MDYFNESILESISSIDSSIIEAEISVMNAQARWCEKELLMEQHSQNATDSEIYTESFGSIVKGGTKKFIELIKQLISMISSVINKIISFVKSKFNKQKNVVNVNNMLLSDDTIELPISEAATSDRRIFFIDIKGNTLNVKINPFTKIKISSQLNKSVWKENIGFPLGFDIATISALREPSLLDNLLMCIKCIENIDGKMKAKTSEMKKYWDEYCKSFASANSITMKDFDIYKETHLNIDKIKLLNKKINVIQKHVDSLYYTDISSYCGATPTSFIAFDNPRFMLDKINAELVNFNQALNTFYSDLKDVYVLIPKMHKRVKTLQQLDIFVSNMLSSGYPAKYIMENVNLSIADESFVNSRFEIKRGQTRAVIIPDDKSFVYKCAFNSSGLSANLNEYKMFKKFSKYKGEHLLAKTYEIGKHGCVIKQECCDTNTPISKTQFDNFINDLIEFTADHKDLRVIGDRKLDMVGRHYKTGEICVTDYGIVSTWQVAEKT